VSAFTRRKPLSGNGQHPVGRLGRRIVSTVERR
jgi:hypothetical protein